MNRFLLIATAAALAAGCAKGDPTGPEAGRAYFFQLGCAACHKVGDEGSAVGPDLTLVGFRHSAQWLDLFIKNPQAWKRDTLMPNKYVPDQARAAVVAWLSQQKGQAWPEGRRPWDDASLTDPVARGRVLFLRAGCVGCHGPEGKGGYPNNNVKGGLIPSLEKASEGYTKAELVDKIRRGVPRPQKADPGGPDPLVWMPSWGEKLSPADLEAVAAYVLSLAPKGAKPDF